jgi:type VI secretion system protein ImpH
MAGEDGGQIPALKERLLDEGKRFTFIQAYRFLFFLLRKEMSPDARESDVLKRIRVRPDLSFAFPGTDIVSIEERPNVPGRFLITATFLGLYGASSPLPAFYTEDLLDEQSQEGSVSRDFLDIFNSRLYDLYFKTWGSRRLFFSLIEEKNQDVLERLFSLIGLGGEKLREGVEAPYEKLRYAGLMTQMPRSAAGLQALIADVFDEPSVRVIQCVERIVEIPREQRFVLGMSVTTLGEDACIGSEIADLLGKFRITVGPIDTEKFNCYLPDKPAFAVLKDVIGFYLDQPLAWDIEAKLTPEETATARLGDAQWGRLGWNTWLFSDGFAPENTAVRLAGVRQ